MLKAHKVTPKGIKWNLPSLPPVIARDQVSCVSLVKNNSFFIQIKQISIMWTDNAEKVGSFLFDLESFDFDFFNVLLPNIFEQYTFLC